MRLPQLQPFQMRLILLNHMTNTIRVALFSFALLVPIAALPHICNPIPNSDEINKLKIAVQSGDVKSMNLLASYYERGAGVEKNYTQSSLLYKSAADKGDVRSQRKTAQNFELGQGVKFDHMEAVRYYKMSQSLEKEDFYPASTIQNAGDRL